MSFAVFRCDASQALGNGHVMRCLTLAHALQKLGWKCAVAGSSDTQCVMSSLTCLGVDFVPLPQKLSLQPQVMAAAFQQADLLVVDHYEWDIKLETPCRSWANKILVIDDLANRNHDCNVLLDQTYGREASCYTKLVPTYCKLLLTSKFALLRPEFAKARKDAIAKRKVSGNIKSILVSLGASDPDNTTATVLNSIAKLDPALKVDVVLGSHAPNLRAIQAMAENQPQQTRVHVDTNAMARLMVNADLAIGAGGTTSWERCCTGLPALVIITAQNQGVVAHELEKFGAIRVLGTPSTVQSEDVTMGIAELSEKDGVAYQKMVHAALQVCDGLGTFEVILSLLNTTQSNDGKSVSLRLARDTDVDMIFMWQTAPQTRRFSRNPKPPKYLDHCHWFSTSLHSDTRIMTIIECNGEASGMLRFDRLDDDNIFELSILIAPDKHGLGIGVASLTLGRELLPTARLQATVLNGNDASHSLFKKAGYIQTSLQLYVNYNRFTQ